MMYSFFRQVGLMFTIGLFFIGCTLPSLLVMDPVLYEFQGEVSNRHYNTVVLDGEYPWEQELHESVSSRTNINSIILSPLLEQAGRSAAVDHPDLAFYLIGADAPPGRGNVPENFVYIPIDRTTAIERLADHLLHYIDTTNDAEVSSGENVRLTLLLYTGTERRRREAELLRSLLSDIPAGAIRIREYSTIPARGGIQSEVVRSARSQPHLLIALLGLRSSDAVQLAVENEVFIFSENVSGTEYLSGMVVGGIEKAFDAAVSTAVKSIHSGRTEILPEAKLWISPGAEIPGKYFRADDR